MDKNGKEFKEITQEKFEEGLEILARAFKGRMDLAIDRYNMFKRHGDDKKNLSISRENMERTIDEYNKIEKYINDYQKKKKNGGITRFLGYEKNGGIEICRRYEEK